MTDNFTEFSSFTLMTWLAFNQLFSFSLNIVEEAICANGFKFRKNGNFFYRLYYTIYSLIYKLIHNLFNFEGFFCYKMFIANDDYSRKQLKFVIYHK